jgi:transposase-like protein
MSFEHRPNMKINCPNPKCVLEFNLGPRSKQIVRNGSYFRKSDSRFVKRFYCRMCSCYFSLATFSNRYCQKVRRINEPLRKLLVSGVSQRRAAKLLGVNPKTVTRRFRFLAEEERIKHSKWLKQYEKTPLSSIQFDDLESSEHTKCKPVSVALAVEPKYRKILGFQVSRMPAKGRLVHLALRKYGIRKDERPNGWNRLMQSLKPYVTKNAIFTSDDNPHYPKYVYKHHPFVKHVTVKGGRGAIAGQGELKKLKFDPIFSLNHSCAMLRANLNRLFRRTWCTTKTIRGLVDHLSLYISYHNFELTQQRPHC